MTLGGSVCRCLVCALVALALSTPSAFAQDSSSAGGGASFLGGSPLVVAGSPLEAEQVHAQEGAVLANPEAVAERKLPRPSMRA
jgi:hypothetical protein